MRIFLVILAALFVAGGTGFYVLQGLQPAATAEVAQAAAPQLRQIYVPAADVPIGTIITPERLSRMEITENALNGEMILVDAAGQEFLAGSVARQVLPQGVPIARSFVVRPGDRGFLAAVLPRGMRAITIPVDAIAGLSGLALPGDRVDLILTYSVSGGGADDVRASETVISNLRVLAFDQRLGPEAPPKDKESKAEGAPVAKTATLEVTPRQAEIITLAQTLGALSLVLNSVRDGGDEKAAKTDTVNLDATLPAFLKAAEATPAGRRQTLESDVTSTSKVKIVRGVQSRATGTASEAAAGPATTE